MLRAALRYTSYPLLTVGSAALAWQAYDRGLPVPAIALGLALLSALAVAGLERALPYSAGWRVARGDVRTDALHYALSSRAFEVGALVALSALARPSSWLWERLGGAPWPSSLPLAAQVALALVLGELPNYLLHRLEHSRRFFFRIHAAHHSAPRLYWLNAARNHPIDNLLAGALVVSPLLLLGASERTLAVMAAFSGVHALLQHGNIDLRLGPLNWVFSACEVHRWHHSRRLEESNANYGGVLLVWDVVFGTRRVPAGAPPEDTGLSAMPSFPQDFLGQLASPFRVGLFEQQGGPPGAGAAGSADKRGPEEARAGRDRGGVLP